MKKMNFRTLLMILVSIMALFAAMSVSAQVRSDNAPLSTAIRADGSLKPDVAGSFDPSGHQLTYGPKGEPRFVPADPKPEGTCSDGWDTSFTTNGANDSVNVIVTDGAGNFYFGGEFTMIGGILANRIAKWDGTTWSALGSGIGSFGAKVNAIAISGSDIYVAGSFTSAGGSPIKGIAKWNGSSWSALGVGFGGPVNALTFLGGDLYAGGDFHTNDGSPATGVARWNGSSWSSVGTVAPYVNAMVVKDGMLYAGGFFDPGGVWRWDGTSWTILGTLTGPVNDLAFSGNELWAAGRFGPSNELKQISKWNGTTWTGVAFLNWDSEANSLAFDGTDLYVGGTFTGQNGLYITDGIVKYNGTTWTGISTGTQGGDHSVNDILISGNTIYTGGNFALAGGVGARNIAKITSGAWGGFPGTGLDARPTTITASGPDLYLGGTFTTAGPFVVNRIAKWDGNAFSAMGSGVSTPGLATPLVNAIAVSNNKVYIGGSFFRAGNVSNVGSITMWNGSTWSALGSGVNSTVSDIAITNDGVYVGGTFTTAGGVTVNRIGKWDGSTWKSLGTGLDGPVSIIRVIGNDIYVTGDFENAGGVPAHKIAKWNGSVWAGLDSGLLVSPPHTIALVGNDLYVASGSPAIDSNSYISKYDGSIWTPLGAGMGGWGVSSMAVIGTDVYISGGFNSVGGVPVNRVAKWNGKAWSALGNGLPGSLNSSNVRIVAVGSDLIATGDFTAAAGSPAGNVAKWNGSSWSAIGLGLDVYAFTMMTAGGDVYFTGNFTTAGCNISPYFARWRHTLWTGATNPDWHTGANWGAGSVPAVNAGVTISANDASITSANVTLSNLIVTNSRTLTIGAGRTLTVNGNLDLRDGFVVGPGTLVVKGDLNLNGGSISNLASLTVERHFTLNGNLSGPTTITVKGDLIMGGNISNTTSLTVEHNLTLNGNSITNAGPITIGGNLALAGGNISGTAMVAVTSCSPAALTGGSTSSFIASPLTRCVNSSGIYRFPVGTGSVYSPVDLSNVVGSANFTVEAHAGPYGTATGLSTNRLQRWWSTANGGITQADMTFNYLDADVVGTEEYYRVFRVSGGAAVRIPTAFQPTANRATISGITTFSDFTMAEGESVVQPMNGRLLTAHGRGAENVIITMTDPLGNTYRTITNPTGFFRFGDLPTIRTYTFSFQSKRYHVPTQTKMFDGDGLLVIVGPDH
jgi:hypothetical protein